MVEYLIKPRAKPQRGDRTERITFEGRKTTTRTRNMTLEQRRLFREEGGGGHPGVTQGGYSSSVSQSAGTHKRDAMDEAIKLFVTRRDRLWEHCAWRVGFAGWIRAALAGVWAKHFHKLPKGGDLSGEARGQVEDFYDSRSALASNKPYPRIRESGLARRTWEGYLDNWEPPVVSLCAVQNHMINGKYHNHIRTVQRGLNWRLGTSLSITGIPDAKTKAAYRRHVNNGVVSANALGALGLGVKP